MRRRDILQREFSKKVRMQFAESWAIAFALERSKVEAGRVHPATFCYEILKRCLFDRLGAGAFNSGKRDLTRSWATPKLSICEASLGNPQIEQFQALRGLSSKAIKILRRWRLGEVALHLYFRVPTVHEVLDRQVEGERCVSALTGLDEMINFETHGRNFISFLVHDLMHAANFFENEESRSSQMKFYGFMREILSSGCLGELGQNETIEYLVSDMNAHIVHLLKVLKSCVLRHRRSAMQGEALMRELASRLPAGMRSDFLGLSTSLENEETRSRLTQNWKIFADKENFVRRQQVRHASELASSIY